MVGSFNSCRVLLVALGFCLSLSCLSYAGEGEEKNTVVTVGEMCGGCVKKITKRFEDEKEVAKVDGNIEKKTVTVVPEECVQLSPMKIWEIMEGISKTPTKLVSPEGTFTSKPN